jgi:hypothetical protein
MILPAADELLAPVMAIDGFRLACLIDGSTGMVLASRENQDGPAPPTAAAGAADVIKCAHPAKRLADSVLPGGPVGGYANLIEARLRKLAGAGSTGMLPLSGRGDGAIFFRGGQVVYAESTRTPTPVRRSVGLAALGLLATHDGPASNGAELVAVPSLERLVSMLALTEPTIDAITELLSSESRPAELPGHRRAVDGARPHRRRKHAEEARDGARPERLRHHHRGVPAAGARHARHSRRPAGDHQRPVPGRTAGDARVVRARPG